MRTTIPIFPENMNKYGIIIIDQQDYSCELRYYDEHGDEITDSDLFSYDYDWHTPIVDLAAKYVKGNAWLSLEKFAY